MKESCVLTVVFHDVGPCPSLSQLPQRCAPSLYCDAQTEGQGVSEKLSGQCSRPTIRTCCEGGNRLLEPGLLSPRRCLSGSNLAFTSRLKTCRKVSEDYSSVFLIHHRHRARFTDFYFLIKKPGREHGLPSHDSTLGMCERACF